MNKFIFLLFILICGCTINNNQESTDQYEDVADPQAELTIDDLQLVDLNGIEVPESALKGKAVFFNLWATWCRPCIEEMPAIIKAREALEEKNAEMLFIFPSNETIAEIKKFKENKNFDLQYYQLLNNYEQMGIYTLPTTLLFNSEGKLVETIVGAQEWDQEDAIDYLTEIAD